MGFLFGSQPSAPAIPPVPPMAAPATIANSSAQNAGAQARKRAAAAGSIAGGLNPTGPEGLSTPPSTAQATLLGQ